jgi:eukaryotic-like serine/threonine-protein kinase
MMADPHDSLKTPPVMHDLAGTTVGRFRIGAPLGAGGMGQVYQAEDTTLKRVVAIKRLAPQYQFDERDRDRLLKEAQRASALNHPNIAAIYDVLVERGEILLVMEYIEGMTLRQRMRRPVSVEEFLEIAVQCVDGLQAAHEKRIVHGDIKPENIMLTASGRVKILDFGVAKRFGIAESTDATESLASMKGSFSGTPAYMAPEVLTQKPYDGRADIFSLGLVFYELLGHKQPFRTESFAGTLGRVLHSEPAPVASLNRDIPPELSALIAKMMIKEAKLRTPNLQAVATDLRLIARHEAPENTFTPVVSERKAKTRSHLIVWGFLLALLAALVLGYWPVRHFTAKRQSAALLPEKQVLAVLPFPASPGNPRLTALGQGLVESVAAKMARFSEDRPLEVIPARNMQEKSAASLEDARRQFGANLGLAITLEQSGNFMRVVYSLLNASTGATIGGDSLKVPANDVFAVEDDIAEGAVRALQIKLRPDEQASLKLHGTTQPAAYDDYLQARGYLLDFTKAENVENAILMAQEALKQDPNFGMAKATLGEAYWRKYWLTKNKSWTVLAQKECDAAIQLGNAGASGHLCLGLVKDGTGQYKEASTQYQRAVELEPTNENAYIGLALAYEHEGAVSNAESTYQRALDTHPQSWVSYNAVGTFYYRRGEYDKASQMFRKVTELAPEGFAGYVNLGAVYNNTGRYSDSIEPLNKSITLRPTYAAYSNLGTAYFGLHNYSEAAKAYEQATRLSPEQYVSWGNLGNARYYSGAREEAKPAFHKAAELAERELSVNPRDPEVLGDLAAYDAMLGERQRALFYLEQSLEHARNDKDLIFNAADVYNQLGETGLALEWLAKAVHAGYPVDKFKDLPVFSNLASNPQYQALVANAQAAR